jgi:hypothetical protein
MRPCSTDASNQEADMNAPRILDLTSALPVLATLHVLAACSVDDPAPDSALAALYADRSCADAAELAFAPSPKAEVRARERLARIAPEAVLAWSHARGTVAMLGGADLPVTGCDLPGADLHRQVLEALAAEPDILQLDPGEWVGSSAPCEWARDGEILSFSRAVMEGRPARSDSLAVILRIRDGALVVGSVHGHYLPATIAGLREYFETCPELDAAEAADAVYRTDLAYDTFAFCAYTGSGTYQPSSPDRIELEKPAFVWEETAGGVVVKLRVRGAVIVDPGHHTPALLASNAHCPRGRVAWRLVFDPARAALIESWPGVDCIVC